MQSIYIVKGNENKQRRTINYFNTLNPYAKNDESTAKTIDGLQLLPKYLCRNFEKRLSVTTGKITDFEIPPQIPHPRFSIIFQREISHFRSRHPTEKERFGKNQTSLHFRKNSVFTRVSYLLKYLLSSPMKALPWRASSRAIS